MKQLPTPQIYEQEMKYMPWGKVVRFVAQYVIRHAPKNGSVVDLMCGPGFLLHDIHQKRPDLRLVGVDYDRRYIQFAKKRYPGITFVQADVLRWNPHKQFSVVLCTAGLHHLKYSQQEPLIRKIRRLVKPAGSFLLADPYIERYSNEKQRRLAAARLGYEYLQAVLSKNAPDQIISATIDILSNDILPHSEYKTYLRRIEKMAKKSFVSVQTKKFWPTYRSDFGDYCLFLKP